MEPNLLENDLIDSVRHTERTLDGSDASDRYVEHAKNARALDAALRARSAPIKGSYRAAGLSYLLARKAIWLDEFLAAHEGDHPALGTKGPSILLFAREAERRLVREGRGDEVPHVLRDLAHGEPRDAVRKKYLGSTEPDALNVLLRALRAGRTEPARRAYMKLDVAERAELTRFAHALARLVEGDVAIAPDRVGDTPHEDEACGAPESRSIGEAVAHMLESSAC